MCEHLKALSDGDSHGHGHEHGHKHREEKQLLGVQISYHEDAMIFRVERVFPLTYEKVRAVTGKKLEELSAWVDENGWLAGHIKGYVTEESRAAMVSVTGNECSVTESTDSLVKLELTGVVFGADERKICEKICEVLAGIEGV